MRLQSSYSDPLVRRVEIAQEALNTFIGKPFVWGETDCVRVCALVLRRAGYNPGLAKFGAYHSQGAARRALKRNNFASLAEAVDAVGLLRITPAAALPGDVIAFPSQEGILDSLTVVLGNGRVLGFLESSDTCGIIAAKLEHAIAAWSVPPNG